jgi:hypothetical protein
MTDNLFYNRDGNPISTQEWATLHKHLAYLRIARTTVSSAADLTKTFDVSTVWLGLDHSFRNGPPLIFETMVFAEGSSDLACRRYSTEAQAREGHAEMVTVVAATVDDAIVMDAE